MVVSGEGMIGGYKLLRSQAVGWTLVSRVMTSAGVCRGCDDILGVTVHVQE